MANNPYVNKVVNAETNATIIDLTADTVAADKMLSGYTAHDASGATVTGSIATRTLLPTATKGSVSNHSVSVTPSITTQAGYITGGTSSGTAVTVTASELVSGNKEITENGTNIDVTNYATVSVAVAGGGSVYQDENGYLVLAEDGGGSAPQGNIPITANGTYDVTSYAGATVNVPVGMTETDLKNYISRTADFNDITWPSGLTTIGSYAFASCTTFNPSSLPSGLTYIGQYAFYNDAGIALTSLPNTVTIINEHAFESCGNLALTSLPSGITTIYGHSFMRCSKLALTSLPSGVKTVQTYAFYACTSLALASLPSGLTSVGSYAFYGCSNIMLSSLPSSMTAVSTAAFQNCTGITSMTLPSSITSIGSSAFKGCSGMTSISCDGVITTLSTDAFLGDSTHSMSLASVSFPNLATTSNLGIVFGSSTAAANACQSLAFCDLGNVPGINGSAFANCYSLTKLVLRKSTGVVSLANSNAFTNTPMAGYNNLTGTVYVPQSLISSYQTAGGWSTLYNNGTLTFAAIEGSDYELD